MQNNYCEDPLRNEPNLQTAQEVDDYLQILSQHQVACEKAAKYMEAEAAKNRITDLKQQLVQKRKKELQQSHYQQRNEIEKAHLEEFNQFNGFWDQKMLKFNEEAKNVEQELTGRQEHEYRQNGEELDRTIPFKPKESSEVLNLKKIEEHLAKQKNYVEAHSIQAKRQNLEREELNNYQLQRTAKIKNQLSQLQQRHSNELSALLQRIKAGQDELKKNRSLDLERLLQKYQNVKNELEQQQQMDVLAYEGQFRTKGIVPLGTQSSIYRSMQSKNIPKQQ